MVPKSYFNVYWWFFTTTTLHKKHNKPKNYRYHQARFFCNTHHKTLPYCKFSQIDWL
ncbi:hypothetical protein HPCPY1662_0037 [Helicobacter pylori CPY1662]|nr:hypothetical protein HPCPY1662_0037 [Helicobacter pylori CPY1662]